MSERVMIIGKGAREHALAYRLSRDGTGNQVREVLISPGNDGIARTFSCVKPESAQPEATIALAKRLQPKLIVIGPEEPLAQGLSDQLRSEGFYVFGPSQRATQIESSKAFMKDLALASRIPTAAHRVFQDERAAVDYAQRARFPLVIKADGLSAGKGVVIAHDFAQAQSAITTLVKAGPIVIEEFLRGAEMSVIALCTKDDALLFAPVRDHKRLLDGDNGPNTGGMGAVGPLPEGSQSGFMSNLKDKVFLPALSHMRKLGCPFQGALFAGLMVEGGDVKLLEFNARFGDPETQALMFGTQIDLYPILLAIACETGISQFAEDSLTKMRPTAAITMAARGYPDSPIGGDEILMKETEPGLGIVFFAGTMSHQGQLVTDGGRILTCTASADSLMMAIRKSYDIVSNISFLGAQYRADIGRTLI